MGYFVARSVMVMVPAFLLGLVVGWLWWGRRATASAPVADEAIELAPHPTSPAHRAEPDRPGGPGPDARPAAVPVAVPVHVVDPVPAAPLDPEVERLLAEAMAAASAPPAPDQDDNPDDDQDDDQDDDPDDPLQRVEGSQDSGRPA